LPLWNRPVSTGMINRVGRPDQRLLAPDQCPQLAQADMASGRGRAGSDRLGHRPILLRCEAQFSLNNVVGWASAEMKHEAAGVHHACR
jgi:hypothetical protein